MATERTFSMIKPDATRRNLTGAITAMLEGAGLRVVASRRVWMSRREAEGFYAVHRGRPFFDELCEFMSSGPTVVQVLEGENAIAKNREVMGATNPANAAEGTIRKVHALSIGENSVHGSAAPTFPQPTTCRRRLAACRWRVRAISVAEVFAHGFSGLIREAKPQQRRAAHGANTFTPSRSRPTASPPRHPTLSPRSTLRPPQPDAPSSRTARGS